jgi:putative DNA primase/helicase
MIDYIDYFAGLNDLKGSEGEEYLLSRNIKILPKKGVRFSGLEFEPETKKYTSSLVSVMTDGRMKINYLHKTFIAAGRKILNINSKKLFTANGLTEEECKSCGSRLLDSTAVKLFNCGNTLGIAEGLETALSATQIYDCPTWSLANATFLGNFVAPNNVKHLIIYADNDKSGRGLLAAFQCGNKNVVRKDGPEKVTIRCPTDVGDFNDMLFTQSDVHDWVLYKK